ncbi:hypothetical protein [Prochlorococcus sp. MIT 1306]|uniref:hypothetical protein n=1 Tax=Prochlorococcus sp. MIT 1306 TaxID=1799667 RepID=UPI0007B38B68|nr:hypothetical protein [Prochlorococcus sp. MIT 1306]KZR62867.1 hypothetical protein PMIT1306_01349 [Prochlorococcus sp. MIT 1306]
MAPQRLLYRLVALDGTPHAVLDAPYESEEAALAAAKNWCDGQGLKCSISQRAIGVEVMTRSGSWRTLVYPGN